MIHQLTLSKVSLDEFEEWFSAASWNMHKDSEPEAIQMAGKVELILAEADGAQIAIQELQKIAGVVLFGLGEYEPCAVLPNGGSAKLVASVFSLRSVASPAADRQFVEEFAYIPSLAV